MCSTGRARVAHPSTHSTPGGRHGNHRQGHRPCQAGSRRPGGKLESLRRQGAQEERKGEAKEELVDEERRAEAAEARVERKEKEIDDLDHRTDPDSLAADRSKEELYEEAQDLGVEGRGLGHE